jgi:hypothetical protein
LQESLHSEDPQTQAAFGGVMPAPHVQRASVLLVGAAQTFPQAPQFFMSESS